MTWRALLVGLLIAGQTLFAAAPVAAQENGMAIGLAAVTDWSPQQPFLDVMKTARPWIGHKPGQWGGQDHKDLQQGGWLDGAGWPLGIPPHLSSIGTVILTDMPQQARSLAGRYRLKYDGNGIVEVSGRVSNVRYGKGQVLFDYTPGDGLVDIRIQRSDRAGKGDYVRNISVVRLDRADAFDAGSLFNPDWLILMQGFSTLRFMDWMRTNNSTQSEWDKRPEPNDYTWARDGVPLEIMLALMTKLQVDGWFNMPHLADDKYVTRFATLVRDRLPEDRKVYVEYSNEVWNWQFKQAGWADERARRDWGAKDAGVQYYAVRAADIATIWSQVFGPSAQDHLVNVISSQTGWLGLEEMVLNAPAWTALESGNTAPAAAFDAYAVTGYFGGILGAEDRVPQVRDWITQSHDAAQSAGRQKGLTGSELDAHIATHRFDTASALAGRELLDGSVSGDANDTLKALLGTTLPHHANVARQYDLDLIMYEGGSHVVGLGAMVDDPDLTDFFTHFNYTPEMGALYGELISGWHDLGGQLFNVYSDVYKPGKWGSWGARRYLSDDNPRWDAIEAAQ